MHVLAFGASTSRSSINRTFAEHAARVLCEEVQPGATYELVDLNEYEMPIYSEDREKAQGIPPAARTLMNKIGACDAVIASFAEHNGSYTAAFKNTFDWMSRIDAKVFQGKPMCALAASPGERGGATVLQAFELSASYFGAEVKGTLSVGSFYERFDSGAKQMKDAETERSLREALVSLSTAVS